MIPSNNFVTEHRSNSNSRPAVVAIAIDIRQPTDGQIFRRPRTNLGLHTTFQHRARPSVCDHHHAEYGAGRDPNQRVGANLGRIQSDIGRPRHGHVPPSEQHQRDDDQLEQQQLELESQDKRVRAVPDEGHGTTFLRKTFGQD